MATTASSGGRPFEPRESLETLATFIHMDVVTVIQSSLVRTVALGFFYKNQSEFRTNPANTLLCESLWSLEGRGVVRISEVLKDENHVFNLQADLRGKLDLEFHRHALSHPNKVRWGRPGMQEFFDALRHWKDNRAAIVWDLHRSISEEMVKLGLEPKLTSVPVTAEMAILVSTILRCSVKAEALSTIPPEPMLLEWLTAKRDEWLEILERIRALPA